MHLQFDHISVSLSGKPVIDDLAFEVNDGEFVSLLGASGAGKSTTLKVIAGLLPQDEGSVLFDGEVVDDLPTHKRSTAIVFQDIRLFPNMNVRDNVAFPLKMKGMGRAERRAVADEMLAAVHLPAMGDRRVHELSGGQQQRVALARALAGKPRLLLLDEPFSGLDEQLRGEMRQLVLALHEQFSMTSLMVTHDADEALTMSDRIVYMADGKLVQAGAPDELLLHPQHQTVAECFGDTAAIKGEVEGGVFHAGKLAVAAEGTQDGPAVLVRVEGGSTFVHPI